MAKVRFSTIAAPHFMGERLTYAEASSRCFAAAKSALRGERWGYTMQADCAADVLADVICENMPQARRGRPADVLAWVSFCERFPTAAQRYAEAIPADRLSFTRLYGLASNWRRAEESKRARVEKVKVSDLVAGMADQDREPGEPQTARAVAVDLLGELGLPRLGKLYPVAYAAARECDGLTGDEIAGELSMARGTLVSQISRAATKVPSAKVRTPREHAEALHVDEYLPAGKRPNGINAPVSGKDPRDWRGDRNPGPDAGKVTTTQGEPTAAPWDGATAADWTSDLRPSTAARLAHAASITRSKSAAKSDDERRRDRAAAGLAPLAA